MKKLFFFLLLSFNCYSEPINLFVTSTAGGNIDLFAREVSRELINQGYNNVILNQGGANGDIAYNSTMSKYNNSILIGAHHNFVISHAVSNRENLHTKTMTIIAPIVEPNFIFITNKKGFNSIDDMIEYAKKEILPCGVPGSTTLEIKRINEVYGTKFEPVIYKGSPQIKMDILGETLTCAFDGFSIYKQEYEMNSLKILASTKNIKNIPLLKNTLKDYSYTAWFGIGIPKDSKLLNDRKLMDVLINIHKNNNLKNFCIENDLVLSKPEKNISTHMIETTEYYKKFN
jgi:tripartite-type tricarboxylate transporter receptor subunit TctC